MSMKHNMILHHLAIAERSVLDWLRTTLARSAIEEERFEYSSTRRENRDRLSFIRAPGLAYSCRLPVAPHKHSTVVYVCMNVQSCMHGRTVVFA